MSTPAGICHPTESCCHVTCTYHGLSFCDPDEPVFGNVGRTNLEGRIEVPCPSNFFQISCF
ncbi:hypothetical protein EGR_07779 [Echinococcus granulosus]|uniref:Uncharacterized protein n=1 Tax=Echinococcus granulosus TaxID=6210 RepID=W6UA40_ECHGR|nr:hypothetical protein EGR_07779 [Echinococcus granulosus]EUB57386.1 hypothetical protein EGR_07779 [Echinococcus granulosus]